MQRQLRFSKLSSRAMAAFYHMGNKKSLSSTDWVIPVPIIPTSPTLEKVDGPDNVENEPLNRRQRLERVP